MLRASGLELIGRLGFGVWEKRFGHLEFGVWGLRFGVQGWGFGVSGPGFLEGLIAGG